jgi:hypothetical protein
MTVTEFSQELDVIYENINKNGAPGLDAYEKSVILTHAQEALVRGILSQDVSASTLPQLIKVYTDTTGTPTGFSWGTVFSIPSDGIFKVLNEKVVDDSNETYTVNQITNEEFDVKQSKPYKYPRRRTAYRLGLLDSTTPSIEIFGRPGVTLNTYKLRYIRKPLPIIVDDITPDTIDGLDTERTSELDISLHREVLKIATTLAEQYYYDKYGNNGTEGNQRQN